MTIFLENEMSTQRGALSFILRSFRSTPKVALEAELGILPIDIRLKELNTMECLKSLRKNNNPKSYPSPL